ncbi:MAG TPA: hypothetical protein DCP71_13285 [Verrucomicrobiales bacterium]|jgi:hypothetical protein|nr:hypothetical protein [Verrucomicrobiales bacterium]
MKSFNQLAQRPSAVPVSAEDISEMHAGRLLLLLRLCGTSNRIEGLTKLAKLDFFVRYPAFLKRAAETLNKEVTTSSTNVESAMVRHHYGPWDKRYYALLPFLESRELITVVKVGATYDFSLTPQGEEIANRMAKHSAFSGLVDHMKDVKKLFGGWKGARLKTFIYQLFKDEVTNRELGETI